MSFIAYTERLSSLTVFCYEMLDIQECTINQERCSQACIEKEGGYTCVCSEAGYKLDVDMSTCVGKWISE